jgi:hypothetical protein
MSDDWFGGRRPSLQFNPPLALVYSRFLKLRREDPANAFSVDQMSQ